MFMKVLPQPLVISANSGSTHAVQPGLLLVFGFAVPVLTVTPERDDPQHRMQWRDRRLYLGTQGPGQPRPLQYTVALYEGPDITITITHGHERHPLAYAVEIRDTPC